MGDVVVLKYLVGVSPPHRVPGDLRSPPSLIHEVVPVISVTHPGRDSGTSLPSVSSTIIDFSPSGVGDVGEGKGSSFMTYSS